METGFEPVYTALQAVASPLGHSTRDRRTGLGNAYGVHRADDGIRTRDPNLGKVVRYQLRYVRMVSTRCSALDDSVARGCQHRHRAKL